MPKTIDKLIINSPYEEPKQYWSYDAKTRTFTKKEGTCPAGYVIASESSRADDFMFQLTRLEGEERQRSRSQFVTLKLGGNIKWPIGFSAKE